MCGIVGYIGKEKAAPILIEGLKRLEYRGYDSAGLVIFNGAHIRLLKVIGRIKELEKKVSGNWKSNIGIAHTRWATHGEPNKKNAHPHTDCANRVFICHNGIIENYKSLRDSLILHGHNFKSETDSEVLAHLIEENLRYGPKLAIIKSLKSVKGSYGLSIVFADYPDRIFAAKNGSPLIIGTGKGENMIASDASAILNLTKDVIYMNDGEMAVLTKDNVKLFSLNKNKNIFSLREMSRRDTKRRERLDLNIDDASKKGYPHFMLKEIFEQPETITESFRGRLSKKEMNINFEELEHIKDRLKKVERIIIAGCGSAYLAGLFGKLTLEELGGIPCETELASELRYHSLPDQRQNLAMVAVSQSGETADTLAALRRFKEKNILTVGIVNVTGSAIAREADAVIYNHAGSEIGVASTKSYTSQLMIFTLFSLFLAKERNMLPVKNRHTMVKEIMKIPTMIHNILNQERKIKELAKRYKNYNNFFYIGRKYNFPTALEGALKLKEISYIHAEGYSAGELKHGPIAMIDENLPTIAIVPEDSVYEKTVSNMEEIKARKGKIIAITIKGNNKINHIAENCLYIDKTSEILMPILSAILLQLFAYFIGTMRNHDVDKPKNLAKSVTVE